MGKRKINTDVLQEDTLKKYQEQLKELHLLSPKDFFEVTGIDVIQAIICLERTKGGKTFGQIAIMLKTSPQAVHDRSKRCGCK